jgi:alkylated DNA repair dioxygenase AlkB
VGWHSDDEKELGREPVIASVSLGGERKFVFKHKRNSEKVEIILAAGSLLIMKGTCQQHWVHSLPKSKKVPDPRINLTFRTIY